MSRSEFPAKVRQAAWLRCNGKCEHAVCGIKLQVGKFHFDHIQPDGLGGKATLENCQVLCLFHHEEKTTQHDNPIMTKADNQMKSHLGLKPKGKWPRKPPGYNSWTRRMDP